MMRLPLWWEEANFPLGNQYPVSVLFPRTMRVYYQCKFGM